MQDLRGTGDSGGELLPWKHVAEDGARAGVLRADLVGPHPPVPHHARVLEVEREAVAQLDQILQQDAAELRLPTCRGTARVIEPGRKGAREDAVTQHVAQRIAAPPERVGAVRHDEGAAPPLRETVVGRVDHAPLDHVAEVGEAGEHHAEVAAALVRRRAQQPVDVLEEDEARPREPDEAVDLPPQHAFLTDDAGGLREHAGHGVVLARKAADYEVDLAEA